MMVIDSKAYQFVEEDWHGVEINVSRESVGRPFVLSFFVYVVRILD
jgi:hypothetical protein